MAINKKLIHFKTKQKFDEELANGNILDTSIVFIKDTKQIYTHGQLYDGSTFDPTDIEASIQNIIDNYATKTEMPTKVSQLENDVPYVIDDVVVKNGLYIYDTDGNFTLPANWNTSNNSKAVGVAILIDDCRFVVAKEDISASTIHWGGYGTDISTLTNYTSGTDAATDFDGVNNTAKIIAAIGNSNDGYRDGTAAGDCASYTFPNGKTGYLGAAGEWQVARQNKEDLNSALTLIGGTTMKESAYRTSTEYSSYGAWYQWFDSDSNLDRSDKYDNRYVRAFLSIEQPKPLKERVSELEQNYFKWSKLILPSFTIAGVSYDFEEGMTWEEWVNSEYNTDGAFVFRDDSGEIQTIYGGPYTSIVFNGSGSERVLPTDIIISGHNYIAHDPAAE